MLGFISNFGMVGLVVALPVVGCGLVGE